MDSMVREEAERRAGKILATARGHLAHHVPRDVRVAAALKTARDVIVRLDPQRLASIRALAPAHELQQKAAAARQERVKRTLGAARDTLKRIAHIKPPSPMSGQIVHKMIENARVAPEAQSPVPGRREEVPPPSAGAIESLSYRFEVLREAVPEAMGEMSTNCGRNAGTGSMRWSARINYSTARSICYTARWPCCARATRHGIGGTAARIGAVTP